MMAGETSRRRPSRPSAVEHPAVGRIGRLQADALVGALGQTFGRTQADQLDMMVAGHEDLPGKSAAEARPVEQATALIYIQTYIRRSPSKPNEAARMRPLAPARRL